MALRGLDPGAGRGRLLARAREAQALGVLDSREEALQWLAEATLEGPDCLSDEAGVPGKSIDSPPGHP